MKLFFALVSSMTNFSIGADNMPSYVEVVKYILERVKRITGKDRKKRPYTNWKIEH